MSGLLISMVLAAALGLWLMVLYSQMTEQRARVRNGFAQINAQLTRRHDLIPNLVEAARGYLAHERSALEAVLAARGSTQTELRRAASDPTSTVAIQKLAAAEQQLGSALGRLLALVESCPDPSARRSMRQLAEELTSANNRVAFVCQTYNDAVIAYNDTVKRLPVALIAQQLAFRPAVLLELDPAAKREMPRVSLE